MVNSDRPPREGTEIPLLRRPETYQHVKGLRAVRRFRNAAIPEEDIVAILEAGRWTGSAKNRQAWAFVVMTDPEDRARLAEVGGPDGPLTRAAVSVALVRLPGGNDFDIGRAAQSMMLAAAALGIGSCAATLHDQERAAEILDLPADHVAQWSIGFGYPDDVAEAELRSARRATIGSGRKPLDEVVHRGRFKCLRITGQPFS